MENFELFNDDEFDSILNQNKFEEIQSNEDNLNYKNCTECNIQMQPNINNTLTCPECGFIKTVIIENLEYEPSMAGYNTNANYHIPIKCIGKNSFQYQK